MQLHPEIHLPSQEFRNLNSNVLPLCCMNQWTYLGHSGHRKTQLHTCSFVGPSSQHTWCGWCSAPDYIFLHTTHFTYDAAHPGLTSTHAAAFTLGAVVANVQEEQEDKDHPLALAATTNWPHWLCFASPRGYTNLQSPPPKENLYLPLIQFVPLLIKFFFST